MPAQPDRTFAGLLASNVLGGVGLAAGIAVGGLLVQQLASTSVAGFGSALGVLGAAVAAVPLAQLAARRGRRISIATGYAIAVVGALITILGATTANMWIAFVGLFLVGSTQATTLQTRYAAADLADGQVRARMMSYVIWAITIGSVLGPNLLGPGARLGRALGLPELAGPYVISITAMLSAIAVVLWLVNPPGATFDRHDENAARTEGTTPAGGGGTPSAGTGSPARTEGTPPAGGGGTPSAGRGPQPHRTISAVGALRWAYSHPVARFAVVAIAVAHAVMVGLMSMTSVHLRDEGQDLALIGLVVSLHILGMWGFSPVFGWACDRFGAIRVAFGGLAILLGSVVLAIFGGFATTVWVITLALFLLGLGWSAVLVSSSSLLAAVDSGEVRLPLQGATDALMHYAGAGAALIGGPVLTWFGYSGLAGLAGMFLLPAGVVGALAWGGRTESFGAGLPVEDRKDPR